MKTLIALSLAATAALAARPALAETQIGVSIGINAPGHYGRIDISNYPRPVLINPQPIIITTPAVVVPAPPLYLYVPDSHRSHWAKHCAAYGACGRPVYFVQETWVRDEHQREQARRKAGKPHKDKDPHERGRSQGKGHDKDKG